MSQSAAEIQILWMGKIHQPQHTIEFPLGEQIVYSSGGVYIHKTMYLSMWTTDET